jgi:hypothetical protein
MGKTGFERLEQYARAVCTGRELARGVTTRRAATAFGSFMRTPFVAWD